MKFSLCLLLAFCSLSLAGTAQKITINLKNSPLVNALTLIEGQSNYSFAYKKDLLQKAKIVSLSIKNKSLKESLDELFRDQPFDYKIYENHIVLILKEVNDKRKMPARLHEEVQQNLSGRVVDSLGAAIIGATVDNVTAKSKTATDAAGNFSLSGKIGDVIQVSYIGYKTITTKVEKINNISITLSTDDNAIEDVVITALGIKRSSRSLTYNVQEVQGSELRENKDANFMNALAGKVAGVTINASTSGIGGSSRVIMRGTKSLSNNNGALYVVDGIPLPSMRQGQSNGLFDGSDGGEGISMFNPDDIESLSLLTGPASSALYGGDAANGVVLITTKKGTSDRFRLDYSNHTSLFNPFVTPKFQTKYGNNPGIFSSWGPELLNPSSYDPLDFFQTGYNNSNSLTMSSGTETSQTYFSIGTVNAGGIIPNNKFNRYNILARNTSSFFDDKLTLDVNAWYINQNGQNNIAQGQYFNPLIATCLFPRGDDISKYQLYERYNSARGIYTQFWPESYADLGFQIQNPYWTINRILNTSDRERIILGTSLNYKILDGLQVTGRVRYDKTNNKLEDKRYATTLKLFASETGFYGINNINEQNFYSDFIANLNKPIGDFSLLANLGSSFSSSSITSLGVRGNLNFVPNFFHTNNILNEGNRLHNQDLDEGHNLFAMFGTAQLGYKNWIFADLTSRVEWNSALIGTSAKAMYYPSAGISAIVSDALNFSNDYVTYLKLRASYGEVGNAPNRFLPNPTYSVSNSGLPSTITSPAFRTLQPERTKSTEVGVNARFFKDVLSLDVTLYQSNTSNQVFNVLLPPSSGFNNTYVNGGKVNNRGIEASLGVNVTKGDFKNSSNVIFSLNRNKIVEMLSPTIDDASGVLVSAPNLIVSSAGTYRMELREGGTMGTYMLLVCIGI